MVANGFIKAEGHVSCIIIGNYFLPTLVFNKS